MTPDVAQLSTWMIKVVLSRVEVVLVVPPPCTLGQAQTGLQAVLVPLAVAQIAAVLCKVGQQQRVADGVPRKRAWRSKHMGNTRKQRSPLSPEGQYR